MATPTKLPPHGKAFYNKKGQFIWCNNDSDVRNAKDQGYTSAAYVPSFWPTTVYNRKTGESKAVGKLEWSEEQNRAAIVQSGPDWTTDHVVAPEPKPDAPARQLDSGLLSELLAEFRLASKRLDDLDEAVSELAGVRISLETRVTDLESVFTAQEAETLVPAVGTTGSAAGLEKTGKHK